MFESVTYWHWVSIAALLLIVELMIGTEFLLWLAGAALLSAVVALIFPELDLWVQLVLFAVFSVAVLIAWAKLSLRRKLQTTDQPNLNKRQYSFVGRTFKLDEAIESGTGHIVIDDSRWKVRGEDASQGAKVKVVDVDGMVLLVEQV